MTAMFGFQICICYFSVLFAFAVILYSKAVECISCLQCQNIRDPSQCENVIQCPADSTCHIESVMTPSFQLEYNLGCEQMKLCKLRECSKDAYGNKTRRASGDISVCSECCYSSNCNLEGCGFKNNKSTLTKCYSCTNVYAGGRICTNTETCDLNVQTCSVFRHPHSIYPDAYDLGCTNRKQCDIFLHLSGDIDPKAKCCDNFLCNGDPSQDLTNETLSVTALTCPPDITKATPVPTTVQATITPIESTTTQPTIPEPTTTQLTTPEPTTTQPTTPKLTTTQPTTPKLTTPKPTTTQPTTAKPTTTQPTTPKPTTTQPTTAKPTTTKPTTTQPTTPKPTTSQPTTVKPTTTQSTTPAATTDPPPKTLPPVTKKCHVCSGPAFLCEQVHDPIDCNPPNNYCINKITNYKDGTRDVVRECGNFDTCYRDWFQGSSDNDRCRQFNQDNEQRLDFQCTFCCVEDLCNDRLHPPNNALYRPV